MLTKEFQSVYNLFKMNFYASMCANSTELTMQEAFSLDIIYMLGHPTILEYAKYMGISQPNATYKINQLIEKGYLIKEVSKEDKRSYRLQVTKKFLVFYRDNDRFIKKVLGDIENIFSPEEVQLLEKMLHTVRMHMTQGDKND
ncbi:MarR family transcriptional regulator [Candidatus Stoquefichus sp. SB1]|jgi:DNA-binding MarR family transcriptional regulator|uniref:MarR family transcriptional regulator n=1 Tax=Candidatus Stoquefichus sp. SB1 TaxID=1658109 RepID=UPI00067F2FD3|nr:MarR family transcriptional regulator [Candidatus Stoquefichus sp. SB1]